LAPTKRGNYRFFSAGSSTCTILLVLLLWILNIYFSNFSNYNLIYGSLGAIFAILLWINWSASIFLICYDLNVSIAKAKSENKRLSEQLEEAETADSLQQHE
jgi:membrane protein